MLDVLYIALSGAFVTLAYSRTLDEGMIFERLGLWLRDGSKWKKPLGGCSFCTSFWVTSIMCVLNFYALDVWAIVSAIAVSMVVVDFLTYNDYLP